MCMLVWMSFNSPNLFALSQQTLQSPLETKQEGSPQLIYTAKPLVLYASSQGQNLALHTIDIPSNCAPGILEFTFMIAFDSFFYLLVCPLSLAHKHSLLPQFIFLSSLIFYYSLLPELAVLL